jgi:hypothetical protein
MLANFVDQLTIEVTSNCQAKCPGCIRHKVVNPITNRVEHPPKNINLTLEAHNRMIDEAAPLKFISYDGGFGDSPLHPDFLEMVKHAAQVEGMEILAISTNASMRNPKWWAELGRILNKYVPIGEIDRGHKVFFDLDGIDQKTQEMYRINTNFDKIIENAKAFIGAGGAACWKMIPFDFNKDLEERAKEMATEIGFFEFHRDRVQRIEQLGAQLAIIKKQHGDDVDFKTFGDVEINLSDEKDLQKNADKAKELVQDVFINPKLTVVENLDKAKEDAGVTCSWSNMGNWQVSHDGTVWRCCWHQSNYNYQTKLNSGNRDAYTRFTSCYDENWNNIYYNNFNDIINHEFFVEELEESFSNKYDDPFMPKLKVCTKRCSDLNLIETPRTS